MWHLTVDSLFSILYLHLLHGLVGGGFHLANIQVCFSSTLYAASVILCGKCDNHSGIWVVIAGIECDIQKVHHINNISPEAKLRMCPILNVFQRNTNKSHVPGILSNTLTLQRQMKTIIWLTHRYSKCFQYSFLRFLTASNKKSRNQLF